jgi:hypothetical protein
MRTKQLFSVIFVTTFFIVVFLVVSHADQSEKGLNLPFHEARKPLENYIDKLYCKAIIGSKIQAVTESAKTASEKFMRPILKKGVNGQISKAPDEFYAKIDQNKLYLASKIEFEIDGDFGGTPPFMILVNNDEHIMSVARDTAGTSAYVGVFYINKNNGIAIWNKTYSHLFHESCPTNHALCFQCTSKDRFEMR